MLFNLWNQDTSLNVDLQFNFTRKFLINFYFIIIIFIFIYFSLFACIHMYMYFIHLFH